MVHSGKRGTVKKGGTEGNGIGWGKEWGGGVSMTTRDERDIRAGNGPRYRERRRKIDEEMRSERKSAFQSDPGRQIRDRSRGSRKLP